LNNTSVFRVALPKSGYPVMACSRWVYLETDMPPLTLERKAFFLPPFFSGGIFIAPFSKGAPA